jgi:sterol desaturase/sphingolipid hydroxylase (fatty acid hydroxylase superfamily)
MMSVNEAAERSEYDKPNPLQQRFRDTVKQRETDADIQGPSERPLECSVDHHMDDLASAVCFEYWFLVSCDQLSMELRGCSDQAAIGGRRSSCNTRIPISRRTATIASVDGLFGLASIQLNAGHAGPLTFWPLYLSVPVALMAVDFVNYWQHRGSHELSGFLGRFLWRSHAAHHLPEQVYVLMHPASHPLNGFIVRGISTVLPLYYLGATPETVMFVGVITTLQGLVSHCNVDLRAGWFNYIFVGTELHRFHHSANLDESKNYAVTFSFIDILFGTFYYRPGKIPARIGVVAPSIYPNSNEFWKVMGLPFHDETKEGFSGVPAPDEL